MIIPNPIPPGATIAVISPASPPKPDRLARGIAYLEKRGYQVRTGKSIEGHNKYLTGHGPEQLEDLHWAFSDEGIDAIICSRGGYGTPRFLDRIDYGMIAANPKPFIGYSDITALQCGFTTQAGLVSFSGPMVSIEMGDPDGFDDYAEEMFWSLVTNPLQGQVLRNPSEQRWKVFTPGVGEGELVGGCLSLYNNLMGTRYFPDFAGKILVLEDIGENVQHIDRMLTQFKHAGFFDQGGIQGLLLGQFIDAWENADENDFSLVELLTDIIGPVDFPIVHDVAYGHNERKMTMPLGARVRLDAEDGSLSLV